ncbi:MAG: type II secretion system protein [Planctomycetales bacterium]|nr:type II secretion system protein [Planctomycetales bacterium]
MTSRWRQFEIRRQRCTRGVTLVELLITVAIISIIASTVLFAMVGAQEAAKEARTKTNIAAIHSLLMEQFESYQTRRVPVATGSMPARLAAARRLQAIRNLMQIELPEGWNEVGLLDDSGKISAYASKFGISDDEAKRFRTALHDAYSRRKATVLSGPNPGELNTNGSAECLFLIITLATGDGEAREHFSDQDIGDTDGDLAPEFLDGWGHPISFRRWPAGFPSPMQTGDTAADHDPFDPTGVDADAYRLIPIIYSGGADEELGLLTAVAANTPYDYPLETVSMTVGGSNFSVKYLNPYADVVAGQRMAAPDGTTSVDNIHNHLQGNN